MDKKRKPTTFWLPALAFVSALLLCLSAGMATAAQSDMTPSKESGLTAPAASDAAASALSGETTQIPVPVSIPAYYNLAEQGRKPKVRSQGNTGTCWAISAVSAIESDLLPEKKIFLSADHMSLNNGFRVTQDDGGDYYMIMSYLADWKGPVLEEEDPYGDGISPDGLNAVLHVQEIRLLRNMPPRVIKQMILKYGAAQSSLCLNRERTDTDEYHYYNPLTSAYFDPVVEELDHDILILGWDDTFSRDNFRIRPPSDGAWICQNTWGDSFGEDGIFYVSYEDRNLFRKDGMVYSRIEDVHNYDHVYENDILGWQGRQGFEGFECWMAGAYTAESDEELKAVGLYSTGPGTTCEVYVIPQFEGEKDLEFLTDRIEQMQTDEGEQMQTDESEQAQADKDGQAQTDETKAGQTEDSETNTIQPDSGERNNKLSNSRVLRAGHMTMDTAGYFTVDLERPVALKAGEQFAVAVWIRTEGETKPVAVEMVKDPFTEPVTLEGRQTWISSDGEIWDSTQSMYQTNVCLKAYTASR